MWTIFRHILVNICSNDIDYRYITCFGNQIWWFNAIVFRLYPITFTTSRIIAKDIELAGYHVPKGVTSILRTCIYYINIVYQTRISNTLKDKFTYIHIQSSMHTLCAVFIIDTYMHTHACTHTIRNNKCGSWLTPKGLAGPVGVLQC